MNKQTKNQQTHKQKYGFVREVMSGVMASRGRLKSRGNGKPADPAYVMCPRVLTDTDKMGAVGDP